MLAGGGLRAAFETVLSSSLSSVHWPLALSSNICSIHEGTQSPGQVCLPVLASSGARLDGVLLSLPFRIMSTSTEAFCLLLNRVSSRSLDWGSDLSSLMPGLLTCFWFSTLLSSGCNSHDFEFISPLRSPDLCLTPRLAAPSAYPPSYPPTEPSCYLPPSLLFLPNRLSPYLTVSLLWLYVHTISPWRMPPHLFSPFVILNGSLCIIFEKWGLVFAFMKVSHRDAGAQNSLNHLWLLHLKRWCCTKRGTQSCAEEGGGNPPVLLALPVCMRGDGMERRPSPSFLSWLRLPGLLH